jgi:hypothetical protein
MLFFNLTQHTYATTDDRVYPFADPVIGRPFQIIDKDAQLGLLWDHVKHQAPRLVPRLRSTMLTPLRWTLSNLNEASEFLGLDEGAQESERFLTPFTHSFVAMMQPPSVDSSQAFWLTPSYSHKGFLPVNDAMIMRLNMRHRALHDRVQMDLAPFYAQNWLSTRGYGGAEASVTIHRQDKNAKPWGKVTLRYAEGSSDLMDRRHGIDFHADVQFTDTMNLTAGVRDSQNSQLGNYVMVRWKLMDLGR